MQLLETVESDVMIDQVELVGEELPPCGQPGKVAHTKDADTANITPGASPTQELIPVFSSTDVVEWIMLGFWYRSFIKRKQKQILRLSIITKHMDTSILNK